MYFNREALEGIVEKNLDLAEAKNKDYSGTIDNITATGKVGLAVRIFDKASRLLSLVQPGHTQEIKDESIRDTANDLCNYALFLVSLLDGTWGKGGTGGDNVSTHNFKGWESEEEWEDGYERLNQLFTEGRYVEVKFKQPVTEEERIGKLELIDDHDKYCVSVTGNYYVISSTSIIAWRKIC